MGLCDTVREFLCSPPEPVQTLVLPMPTNEFQEYRKKLETSVKAVSVVSSQDHYHESLRLAKAEAVLMEDRLRTADQEQLQQIRDGWVPEVSLVEYKVGTFLKYLEHEWPVQYITSIKITSPGAAPKAEIGIMGDGYRNQGAFYVRQEGNDGEIEVCLSGGGKQTVEVSRHKVMFVHKALHDAWKTPKV